jgi:hypothetical protein
MRAPPLERRAQDQREARAEGAAGVGHSFLPRPAPAHARPRLFDLAIDSKLRRCDVVRVKIGDLVLGAQVRTRAIIVQAKTGTPVQLELMPDARASLLA